MSEIAHLNAPGTTRYFVLDPDHRPVQVTEEQWRAQSRGQRNTVAEDEVPHGKVWTAFNGIALEDGDEKQLFFTETLFGEEGLQEATYSTWAAAEAGHRAIVARYKEKFLATNVVDFKAP